MKYIYEKHPVSKERKAELRSMGYTILDIRYAPDGYVNPLKAESQSVVQSDDLDSLDAEQLHELAKERGVKVHANAGADKVREALRNAE